jgi:predicted DNA-binding ribbon-helix-helix protein
MERISPSELARRKSAIARRYVTINGRNSSVCLESAFWDALKEIADIRGATRATIVSTIESEGRPRNQVVGNPCVCAGPLSGKNR